MQYEFLVVPILILDEAMERDLILEEGTVDM